MEELAKCDVCQKSAQHKCGGCHSVFYCSKEHQKAGWKSHKRACRPFKVCDDEVIGRYLAATKQIKEGDVVLQEQPLIWGPLETTPPVCMGCGNSINSETSTPCLKCGWPLCSKKCQNSPSHIPECHYTVQRGEKISINNFDLPHPCYKCITALRCLYQKKFVPDVWTKLMRLESHCEERKNTEQYENNKLYVAQFIRNFFRLDNEFSEEEILKICGVIMINGHELPVTTQPHVAIFQLTSMLEHHCRSNCYKTFSSQGHVVIVAGKLIQKGDHLSICYTDPLWTTPARKRHLLETKFFSCACDRCMDVTEFGTYFSALKCQKENCDGLLLPKTFLVEGSTWVCKKCKNEQTADSIEKLLEHIGKDLHAMEKGNPDACKKFLEFYGKLLPQNHFYITDVKMALAHIIDQEVKRGTKISDNDLALEIKLLRQTVELVQIIVPAEKRLKGVLLFELHGAVTEMGRRHGNAGGMEPGDFLSTLMESKLLLTEAIECLKREPDVLQEGKLCQQAKLNLGKLEVLLRSFVQSLDKENCFS